MKKKSLNSNQLSKKSQNKHAMIPKIKFLIMFLILQNFCIKGQNTDTKRFKKRYAISSNYGMVIPVGSFSSKNNIGTNFGAVLEADLKEHLFVRFTWDMAEFNYLTQAEIGRKLVDIKAENSTNAFYLSLGYYQNIKKWRIYSFAGMGFATLSEPKLTTELVGNANYAYLSNQNTSSFMANYGVGAGYKLSKNEFLMLESSFMQMPNMVDNATYTSLQLVYHAFITSSK